MEISQSHPIETEVIEGVAVCFHQFAPILVIQHLLFDTLLAQFQLIILFFEELLHETCFDIRLHHSNMLS